MSKREKPVPEREAPMNRFKQLLSSLLSVSKKELDSALRARGTTAGSSRSERGGA